MRIAVLTTGRQDWGILRSTCRALEREEILELCLLVGGMHCHDAFGRTEQTIEEEGFLVAERLAWPVVDTGAPEQAGAALVDVAHALTQQAAEALLLVGDRFETAAAALAATLVGVPIAHLHGGERTEGAFDDALRDSITKLSHLHLVSHSDHARSVVALGEAPETVHVVGAPGLDNVRRDDLPGRGELEALLGIALEPPVVVVTVHPGTWEGDAGAVGRAVANAMDRVRASYVITLPNTDPGHEPLREMLSRAAERNRGAAVAALGVRRYFGLLRLADAMLGNSSSALIEAPAFELPAVNVGDRQKGRLRGDNVVDVPAEADAVADALVRALEPGTRARFRGSRSPYGDGRSAERIVAILREWRPPRPPRKAGVLP